MGPAAGRWFRRHHSRISRQLRERCTARGVAFPLETEYGSFPHLIASALGSCAPVELPAPACCFESGAARFLPLLQGLRPGCGLAGMPWCLLWHGVRHVLDRSGEGEFLCAGDTPPWPLHPHDSGDGGRRVRLGRRWASSSTTRPVSGCQRSPAVTGTEHVADKRSFSHFMHKKIPRGSRNGGALGGRTCRSAASPAPVPVGPAWRSGVRSVERIQIWPAHRAAMPGPGGRLPARAAGAFPPACSTPASSAMPPTPPDATRYDRGHPSSVENGERLALC